VKHLKIRVNPGDRISVLRKIVFIPLLLFSLATLVACHPGHLRLTAQFDGIDFLVKGDRILFQNENIGKVGRITRTDAGQFLVELDIESDHRKEVTTYSIFYIDGDPDRPGRKAVVTRQTKPGGIPLTDKSLVAGLDHPPYLLNMLDDLRRQAEELTDDLAEKLGRARESSQETSAELARRLNESLAEIEKEMRELEQEARTAPDSDEARELRRNLDRLVADLETTMAQVKTTIGRDLFRSLNESLADLHRRLEEMNRENRHPRQPEMTKNGSGDKPGTEI